MNCLYDMKKIFPLIISLALVVVGCSESQEKDLGLDHRNKALLKMGMIYYGEDPHARNFNDMYYAFAASQSEISEASLAAKGDFKAKVHDLSRKERKYLKTVFEDIADLAVLANYSYKDEQVLLPKGWVDMGKQNPKIEEIFDRPSEYRLLPMGLKCSLMSKGERQVLVFAGTDFPSTWKKYDQVLHFLSDAYEDVYGALNMDATQVVLAREVVDELIAAGYVKKENLEFAGHSLGGRLASEMSVRYGCPAVIFNSAGVSPQVYKDYVEARRTADDQWRGYIINVVSANDPLTCVQKYMSESKASLLAKVSKIIFTDRKTRDQFVSIGLDLIGSVVGNANGKEYRAIGAVMPIRENMAGHGIKDLAASLRERAEMCD